jgi:hypothetical protein
MRLASARTRCAVSLLPGSSIPFKSGRKSSAEICAIGRLPSAGFRYLSTIHYSKGTQGRDLLDRLTGSLAFGAAPRLVFAASKKVAQDGTEEGRTAAPMRQLRALQFRPQPGRPGTVWQVQDRDGAVYPTPALRRIRGKH